MRVVVVVVGALAAAENAAGDSVLAAVLEMVEVTDLGHLEEEEVAGLPFPLSSLSTLASKHDFISFFLNT